MGRETSGALADSKSAADESKISMGGNRLEQKIITMMLQYPQILPEIDRQKILKHFESKLLKSIGTTILDRNLKSQAMVADLLNTIEDSEQRRLMAALAMTDEFWDEKGSQMLISQFVDIIQRRHQNKVMDEQIKAAESKNDQSLLYKLLQEKQKQAMRSAKQKQTLLNNK